MTTYNTGNPIGSTNVKDLYDNAQNFDTLSTTTTLETVPDRLGVPRMSLHGFEKEAKRRFESIKFQPPIPYAPGIEVTTSSLTVDYLGVLYYALPSALPFTTVAWNPAQWSPLQNTNPGNELLVFDDYAAASTAAATLPDGQQIEAPDSDGRISLFTVQSGALMFKDFAPDAIRLESYTALRAYTGKVKAVDITTPGVAGRFNLDAADTVTADNGGTVIVDAQSRRWKRQFTGPVHLKWFELTGLEDCTLQLQVALDSLLYGGEFLLEGLVQFSSITIPTGVTIRGTGSYPSVLHSKATTGTAITMQSASKILDCKISGVVGRTTGFLVDMVGNGCEYRGDVEGYYIGFNVGRIGDPVIVNPRIDAVFRNPVIRSGGGAVQFVNFSNAVIRALATGPDSGAQPTFGIRFQNGDTAFVLPGTNVTRHGRALFVDTPAGLHLYALNVNGSYLDSAGQDPDGNWADVAEFAPAGAVLNTLISNSWFGLAEGGQGCALRPQGSGVIDGIAYSGTEFTGNAQSGLLVVGPNVRNWQVTGGHSGGNGFAGVRATGGTTHFNVNGHNAGNTGQRGPNNIGILIEDGSRDYNVSGNSVLGNTTAGILDNSTGDNSMIENNLGYNGTEASSTLVVGPSPWVYKAGHTPETLYISGGAVSEVGIDLTVVLTETGAAVPLSPGQMVTIKYTAAPTVVRKKH